MIRTYTFRLHAIPYSGTHGWTTVNAPVYHASLVRVHPDGRDRQLVTSQDGYGFAQVNVLPGDSQVVFDYVPSDYVLWKHRRDHLSLALIRRYGPVPRIEMATIGHKPTTLVSRGRLPAVQP